MPLSIHAKSFLLLSVENLLEYKKKGGKE